jgi:hypothetical protein
MKTAMKVGKGSLTITTEFGWRRRYLIERRGSELEVIREGFAPARACFTRKPCGCLAVDRQATTIGDHDLGLIVEKLERREKHAKLLGKRSRGGPEATA